VFGEFIRLGYLGLEFQVVGGSIEEKIVFGRRLAESLERGVV
jgi:hypothetical protein